MSDQDDILLAEDLDDEEYDLGNDEEEALLADDYGIDEIHDQHYDHLYSKNIATQYVNDDCLNQIFMRVPPCERPKIALVCKKWKNVLDRDWYDVKKLEFTYWKDEYWFEKFLNTDGGYSFLKSLLNKCGRYLTRLDLTGYDHSNLVPCIKNTCPKLETLRIKYTTLEHVIPNSFTSQKKLTSLTIIFENISKTEFLSSNRLLNSLRTVPLTLIHLSLLNWFEDLWFDFDYTDQIYSVVRRLPLLETLEISGLRLYSERDHLMERIKFFNLSAVIRSVNLSLPQFMRDIKILRIRQFNVKDDTLYTIANILNLEILDFDSDLITDKGVIAISKMNCLKTLNFNGYVEITDFSVKLLKNMEKIALPSSLNVSDDALIAIITNSPNLGAFCVYGINATAKFVEKVIELSDNRKKHLKLMLARIKNIEKYESQYCDIEVFEKVQK